jgi:hypothetical protein
MLVFTWQSIEVGVYLEYKKSWSLLGLQEEHQGVKRSFCLRGSQDKMIFNWESREAGFSLGFQRSWSLPGSQEKLEFTVPGSQETPEFTMQGFKRSWSYL